AQAFAPALEFRDHRSMGLGPLPGREALLDALRALLEVAADVVNRIDDVLRLQPDMLLVRMTNFGTQRVGGGEYERPFLMLGSFGPDGLVTRLEQFDIGREAEAVARFDELALSAVPGRRRVRANAATANTARHDAAFARRDADALVALYAEDVENVEHPTGVVYDREGGLRSWRSLLGARDPRYEHEPLATLGDSLALCRASWSASGLAGGKFDVGAYEVERINLVEVDARGCRRRVESFAPERLGDAIGRLYERYADILPDGQARARGAATARSISAQ